MPSRTVRRWTTRAALLLGALSLPAVFADPPTTTPATSPSDQARLDKAILNLGHPSPQVREQASRDLWTMGKPAEAALKAAAAGDDPEIAARAKGILRDFKLGISPDAPPAVLENIRQYQQGDAAERIKALRMLAGLGRDGLGAVLKLYATETDANSRQTILAQLRAAGQQTSARAAVAMGETEVAEALLEGGSRSTKAAARDYAAWLLARNTLDAKINELENIQGNDLLLVYLYRARAKEGDLGQARAILARSKDDWDQASLWYEAKQWDKLAGLFEPPNRRADSADGRNLRIGLLFLAGDKAGLDAAIASAKEWVAGHPEDAWYTAKALLLAERREEAFALLRERKMYRTLFDVLRSNGRINEALKLADQESGPSDSQTERIAVLAEAARLQNRLGEKEKAVEFADAAARLAQKAQDNPPTPPPVAPGGRPTPPSPAVPTWVWGVLARAESELGRQDQMKQRLLDGLERLGEADETWLFDSPFPRRGQQAAAWWQLLKITHADVSTAGRLDRLLAVLGKAPPADALAEGLKTMPKLLAGQKDAYRAERLATGLADYFSLLDRPTDAEAALLAIAEAGKSYLPWQRLGDMAADANDWPKAADRYTRAVERGPDNAALLYLRGFALTKIGREHEGRKLIQQAKTIPLADGYARQLLADAMEKRGDAVAAKDQLDFILRTSEPGLYSQAENVYRNMADTLAKQGKYLEAADLVEPSLLSVYRTGSSFVDNGMYLAARYLSHAWRARGLAAKGDAAGALEQAKLALEALPDNGELPIALVPMLEKAGHKPEADALWKLTWDRHLQVIKDFPKYAQGHNAAAWLASQCDRELSKGLELAERAAELAPDSSAFIDTQAEVLFRLGRKDDAIAKMKRCQELDPKNEYFRKQMKRFEGMGE